MFQEILPAHSLAQLDRLLRLAYTFPMLLAAFSICLLISAPQAYASPTCSKKAAKKEIRKVKPHFFSVGKWGDYVVNLVCHDFNGDGQDDMAFVKGVTGSAGRVGWVIFNATPEGTWKLSLYRPNDYKVSIEAKGLDIESTFPIYRSKDPNCCPTGGTRVRLWRWNGANYVVTESRVEQD